MKPSMRTAIAWLAAPAAALAMMAATAEASRAVPRTLTGCVENGVFTTKDGYDITVLGQDNQRVDLNGYNGMRIRVSGSLLPGDRFYPKSRIERIGSCR